MAAAMLFATAEDLRAQDETGAEEVFEDPFANPETSSPSGSSDQIDAAPIEESSMPAPDSAVPAVPEGEPAILPAPSVDGPAPQIGEPGSVPVKESTGGILFEGEDPQFEEAPPRAAPSVSPLEEPAVTPREDFQFPQVEGEKGSPISQEIRRSQDLQVRATRGNWSLGVVAGAGLNLNRRHSQAALEVSGGYRLTDHWELGLTVSSRVVKDKLLGALVMGRYGFRLTDPPSLRTELLVGAGLGWTLRAPKSKFTEGRLTGRVQVDGLFYALSSFAVVTSFALESFFLSMTNQGDTTNFFSGKGPPTQGLVLVGVRFDL